MKEKKKRKKKKEDQNTLSKRGKQGFKGLGSERVKPSGIVKRRKKSEKTQKGCKNKHWPIKTNEGWEFNEKIYFENVL